MQVKNKLFIVFVLGFLTCIAQDNKGEMVSVSTTQLEELIKNEEIYANWIKELETPGVKVEGNQMLFSAEAQKLITYPEYRKNVYKQVYSFEDVQKSIQKLELQRAFWEMINMYPENKEQVLQYIYAYDSVIPTDKVVAASFYTYAFFDPTITEITNGKPNVLRPDIFEEHLKNTNEIVKYIQYFRTQKPEK